jgi:ABC-2 type transport system ATP-binding protein
VLLSTHILSEVQATCDRVLIIHQGRLVADGTTADITARTRGGALLHVTFAPGSVAPPEADVRAALAAVPGVQAVRPMEGAEAAHLAYEVLAQGDVRAEIFRLAVARGLLLLELAPERTNLEEVFRRLTGAEAPSAA